PNSIEAILTAPSAAPSSASSAPSAKDSTPEARLNEDQKAQMEVALRRGAAKVEHCDEVVANCPLGESEVQVVFDGQKGKVTDVLVTSPPFAGTPAEACIKRSFVNEIIMPFDGDPINVPFTIKITGANTPAGDKAKKKK